LEKRWIYRNERTSTISFPLGGIGTGSIGLAGNGRLIDWEIFNRPNKGSYNGFTHFAVKAEDENRVIDARVLNGDLHPPYTGEVGNILYQGFGFGPSRYSMAGVPHFKDVEFIGEFPIARLIFKDEKFPGVIEMTAFNPFIPLNDRDSSIPGAFFDIKITNTSLRPLNFTLALSIANPLKGGVNNFKKLNQFSIIHLETNQIKLDDPEYGDLSIATDAKDTSYQEYWYRGNWFDELEVFWKDFSRLGKFHNRRYNAIRDKGNDTATLAAHVKLDPGESRSIHFVIAWNFPNMYNYWNPEPNLAKQKIWKNYYSTLFKDSLESAVYSLNEWDRLFNETLVFKEALFNSTLPEVVIDAISANLSILKSPTCLRLEDGSFYGFEGCHSFSGCCEGSCIHVWNYAYALPFLFPNLERSMRELNYKYNQREDGGITFRLQLPLGRERWNFRPCVDGQFGEVFKVYREWKISGDNEWLKSMWNYVKKAIEFAWSPTNEDLWDADKDGVIEGRQHHTLDMELFGPNSWLTGMYLLALKAAYKMADYVGDKEFAEECLRLFNSGKRWMNENLFNGEYFIQKIDLKDKSILEKYSEKDTTTLIGSTTVDAYWDNESQEIKYQISEGCEIDQVLAQWHSDLIGLGEIFDEDKLGKALKSIYKYNFKKPIRDFFNPCRLFCLNDEAGVVICEWPENKIRPKVPIPYAQETMPGFEYQFAAQLIKRGMVEEGLEVIRAIRDRYDGKKRNPWNEFECGSNYARSMASYSLLLVFSGFEYDMREGLIGFSPIDVKSDTSSYKIFWCLNTGWGIFEKKDNIIRLEVLCGKLKIKTFKSNLIEDKDLVSVFLGDSALEFNKEKDKVIFYSEETITRERPLVLIYKTI
jgi:uncharacterized protein (DUF608 family)